MTYKHFRHAIHCPLPEYSRRCSITSIARVLLFSQISPIFPHRICCDKLDTTFIVKGLRSRSSQSGQRWYYKLHERSKVTYVENAALEQANKSISALFNITSTCARRLTDKYWVVSRLLVRRNKSSTKNNKKTYLFSIDKLVEISTFILRHLPFHNDSLWFEELKPAKKARTKTKEPGSNSWNHEPAWPSFQYCYRKVYLRNIFRRTNKQLWIQAWVTLSFFWFNLLREL